MIIKLLQDCTIEGRKYIAGMVVDVPETLHLPYGLAEDPPLENIVISHNMEDAEKAGMVEVA